MIRVEFERVSHESVGISSSAIENSSITPKAKPYRDAWADDYAPRQGLRGRLVGSLVPAYDICATLLQKHIWELL